MCEECVCVFVHFGCMIERVCVYVSVSMYVNESGTKM